MQSNSITPLAELRDASKQYGSLKALENLDLSLRAGELTALLGPNGAGKSTAIGLLLGLLKPTSGEVFLLGRSPQDLAARRQIGVMLQSAELPDSNTVGELLQLTRSYYAAPLGTRECVDLAGLDGLLDRRYAKLSGGQQRRVQFALAVCGRPRLLFLDEPTTGLDVEARQGLWRAIRELVASGCSILLTTHYLEEAEALADRVVVINHGHCVADGTVAQVRARVAQRRIRCRSSISAEAVALWPEVRHARVDSGNLEIIADSAEPVVRRLLAEDARLHDLEVQRAGLTEAFIELTREAA